MQRYSSTDQGYNVNDKGQPINPSGYPLETYSNAVKEVCEFYSIPCVDAYHEFGINPINILTYTADGLHPNLLGSKRISKII